MYFNRLAELVNQIIKSVEVYQFGIFVRRYHKILLLTGHIHSIAQSRVEDYYENNSTDW